MNLPGFTAGVLRGCATIMETVAEEVEKVKSSYSRDPLEFSEFVNVIEKTTDGQEVVRRVEVTSSNSETTPPTENQLLLRGIIARAEEARHQKRLTFSDNAPSMGSISIEKLLDVLLAEGKLQTISDGLAVIIHGYRVDQPLSIKISRDKNAPDKLSVEFIGLDKASSCMVCGTLAEEKVFVAEVAKYFQLNAGINEILFRVSSGYSGVTEIETSARAMKQVERVNPRVHYPNYHYHPRGICYCP
jgi:hypothetical protein